MSVLLVLNMYRQKDWNGPGSCKKTIFFEMQILVPMGLLLRIASFIMTESGSKINNCRSTVLLSGRSIIISIIKNI
jgi:hypothetical protein